MMEWKHLISPHRVGRRRDEPAPLNPARSPFQRDFDRIVFSSAFRRMQDKTQVFPLSGNDYVRTRLTHSLETASIGRSLGSTAGVFLCREFDTGGAHPSDFGAIVAAAALGHDIGNPPLGHGGEESIRDWFLRSDDRKTLRPEMTPAEWNDITCYEGNAQGFRVLARLQMPDQPGGMQLTCATLGAFAKYPRASLTEAVPPGVAGKKFNFFQADKELFREVAESTGMIAVGEDSYCRHPLAYLVEAADDIAYRIVDFEDLVRQSVEVFSARQREILAGELRESLIDLIPAAPILREIQRRSVEAIYHAPQVASVIAAGFELLSGMLEIFIPTVHEIAAEENGGPRASYRARRFFHIIPAHFAPVGQAAWRESAYLRTLLILDYLAGMTDSYAVNLYKKLKGISL